MENKSLMEEIRSIPIGTHKDFPMKSARTIQNYRTFLNSEGYIAGHRWEAVIVKKEGVIRAKRIQ